MSAIGRALVVRAGARRCALPLASVRETMRAMATAPCRGAPTWVKGATVLRGVPTPVVDLAAFLGGTETADERGRLVTVVHGGAQIALLVDAVVGVRALDTVAQGSPLLDGVDAARREALAVLDGELLAVLELGAVLPDDFTVDVAPEREAHVG